MENGERIVELVRLSKLGNAHAFSELYESIYVDLYKYALYTLGNAQDAENAVSDTVLDAYAGIVRLRDEKAFRGWIFRILSNKCNRIIREYVQRRQNQAQYPVEDMSQSASYSEGSIENAENRTMIQTAFTVLSEEAKQAKREYERKWRAENKDKVLAIKRRYWEKQAEKVKEGKPIEN